MPKMPSPPPRIPAENLATLDDTATALDDGGGEGVALGSSLARS